MAEDIKAAPMELPTLYVTPDDDKSPGTAGGLKPGGALVQPPYVPAHEVQVAQRANGYSWDEIDRHNTDMGMAAAASGYTDREIDEYNGWPDPAPFHERQGALWQGRLAADPAIADVFQPNASIEAITGPEMREDYARALTDGHAKDAGDFAHAYVNTLAQQTSDDNGLVPQATKDRASEIIPELAKSLPSHQHILDFAIGLTHDADVPVTPVTVANTKTNLIDAWASTTAAMGDVYNAAQSNPAFRAQLTSPRTAPYVADDSSMLRRVYNAVKTGATDAYAEPLSANITDWNKFEQYFGKPDTPLGVLNHLVGVAASGALSAADAGLRLPGAVLQGIARGGGQLLQEAGVSEADADRSVRDVLALSMAVGAKETPLRLRVVDPIKAPGEAVREASATQAFARDDALHEQAQALTRGEKPAEPAPGETVSPEAKERTENAAELAKGYDAATAMWGQLTEMHAGLSLPHAWQGLQALWRGPQGMIDAAGRAAANEFAQATIRRYRGMADREIAAHFNTLEEYRRAINEHMPEFSRWVRMGPMKPAQKPLIMDLIDYIEGRSAGATLDPNSPFKPVADALRNVHEAIRSEIETFDPNMQSFIEDYYSHLWVDPRAALRAFNTGTPLPTAAGSGRQGSGAALQKRSIPTISAGLNAGMMPKILDPIENTLHYASGMLHFIASRKVLEDSRTAGYVKYGTTSPEPGWIPLKGAASVLPAGADAIQRAYAPPGFASAYNNWLGKGFYDHPIGGPLYHGLQYAANAMTALKLAWWGYHATNIAKETAIAQMANGIGQIARGDLIAGLRDMGYGASVLPGIVDYATKGKAFQDKYLDLTNKDPIVSLLTEAGFNPMGRSQRYSGLASPDIQTAARGASYIQMARRRSLGWQLAEEARSIGGNPGDTAFYRTVMAGPRAAGFLINQFERVLDTINAPLFDTIIPKVKTAAAASEMEAWLRRNPSATREEQLSIARKLADSMDDRFGELNQDNLFWPRTLKQMLNLATVSVGWEYGSARAYGGAAKDIMNGELNTTRARWMIAFPMQMALMNSLYQRLVGNGQWPSDMKDLVFPKTGGSVTSKYGTVPERAISPGYEKDAAQTYKSFANVPDFTRIPANIANQMMGKLNPFWQSLRGSVSGQDAVGHYIYNQPHPPFQNWHIPSPVANWLRYMGEEFLPIAANSQMQMAPGTNISRLQRLLGYQPAGAFFQNPTGAASGVAAGERYRDKQAARRAAREAEQ